jgi:monoamine oxidase
MKINNRINRRDALKAIALAACSRPLIEMHAATKKVIVAGAGISGLCCAYDLVKKGFEVVVLEAAGRSGGHILTVRDGLDDGLYADGGAEHFYRPGYDQLWTYIDEMQLPVIAYPRRRNLLTRIGDRLYAKEELSAPSMLGEQGYNQREIEYICKNSIYEPPRPLLRRIHRPIRR